MSLKHIRRPELFQGKLDKKHYFEGWYFKHVDGSGKHTVAFIPGISLDEAGDSFMCSIAHIPFGLFSFRGLIANLHLGGKEYRFATYNRSRVNDFVIEEKRISFKLEKDDLVLSCEAQLVEDGALKAPEKGEMLRTIKEGLGGRVSLKLMEKGKVLAVLESECAGIEIVTNGRLANPKK